MWIIVQHWFKNTRSLLFFSLIILLVLLTGSDAQANTTDSTTILVLATLVLTLIYSGITFLNILSNEHHQGTIFLLLASPQRRRTIYLAKIIAGTAALFIILLLQLLIAGYKIFDWETYLTVILPRILPKVLYQAMANALFWGSFCILLGQIIRPSLSRWINIMISVYGAFSVVYLLLLLNSNLLESDKLFFKIFNILYYQHFIFIAKNPMTMATYFFLAALALFSLGGWLFNRRNFSPV